VLFECYDPRIDQKYRIRKAIEDELEVIRIKESRGNKSYEAKIPLRIISISTESFWNTRSSFRRCMYERLGGMFIYQFEKYTK
jgi:hypothetical protein